MTVETNNDKDSAQDFCKIQLGSAPEMWRLTGARWRKYAEERSKGTSIAEQSKRQYLDVSQEHRGLGVG